MDKDFRLKGLITIKDIEKAEVYPNSARDEKAACWWVPPSAPPRTCWTGYPLWWRPAWMC